MPKATGILSLVLTPKSQSLLAETYASLDEVKCHHMTVVYGTHELSALPDNLENAQAGDPFTLRVFGFARSTFLEAVAVGLLKDGKFVLAGITKNKIPHITVSLTSGKATPLESNNLLEEGFTFVPDGLELEAYLDVVTFDK